MQVVIIDDNDHAVKQVRHNFPAQLQSQVEFHHYKSFVAYSEKELFQSNILFLDYFLDLDQKLGTEFIDKIESEYFVGFGSMEPTTQALAEEATRSKRWNVGKIFGIRKIKESLENPRLKEVLEQILLGRSPVSVGTQEHPGGSK